MRDLLAKLQSMARDMRDSPMLSRTHGQTGEPDDAGQGDREFRIATRSRPAQQFAERRGPRQVQRRGRQLQRTRHRVSRRGLGPDRPELRRIPRAGSESVHDADRTARLDRRVRARAHALQHDPHRPVPRRVGLHLAGLFPAAGREGRSRILDDAAQGQSRSISRMRKATSVSPMRCWATLPRNCRSRAGSAISPIRRCSAISA